MGLRILFTLLTVAVVPSALAFSLGGHASLRHIALRRNTESGIQRNPPLLAPRPAAVLRQTKGSGDKGDSSDLADKVLNNTLSGNVGERGEVYVALQVVLCLLVGVGSLFDEAVESVSIPIGLALCAYGIGMGYLGTQDLGSNLTPWPKPIDDGSLQRDGVYGIVRHPLYSSIVIGCAGLSILTISFPRLLLTGILYGLLTAKAAREEEMLCETFSDYGDYCGQVPDRLIPYAALLASSLRTLSGAK